MLTIYHAPMTRGLRVIWLCHELGVDIDVKNIDFSPAYRASDEWRAMSPTGKVPVLTDGEVTMYESCAMVQYVLDKYGEGRLQPPIGSPEGALYHQWCWFAEATFARPVGDLIHHTKLRAPEDRIAAVVPDAIARATLCLNAVEAHLEGRDYLLDDFGAADIVMSWTLLCGVAAELPMDGSARTLAYLDRLKERPGLKHAMAA